MQTLCRICDNIRIRALEGKVPYSDYVKIRIRVLEGKTPYCYYVEVIVMKRSVLLTFLDKVQGKSRNGESTHEIKIVRILMDRILLHRWEIGAIPSCVTML